MLSTLIFAVLAASPADASTIIGDPVLVVDTSGNNDVLLWSLELEECITGDIESFPLRRWFTPGTGTTFTAPEGDWCEISATLGGPGNAQLLTSAAGDTLITDATSTQTVELFLDQANAAIDLSHL